MFGLNYGPSELLLCRQVRGHLRFPYVVYWDHMHCLTASGGVAQYIVNQMVLRFCAIMGMRVPDLDTFHMALEGIPRLRKELFKTRLVNDGRIHVRGFAADCLAAMARVGATSGDVWVVVAVMVGGARRKWWLKVACGRRQRVMMMRAPCVRTFGMRVKCWRRSW